MEPMIPKKDKVTCDAGEMDVIRPAEGSLADKVTLDNVGEAVGEDVGEAVEEMISSASSGKHPSAFPWAHELVMEHKLVENMLSAPFASRSVRSKSISVPLFKFTPHKLPALMVLI